MRKDVTKHEIRWELEANQLKNFVVHMNENPADGGRYPVIILYAPTPTLARTILAS